MVDPYCCGPPGVYGDWQLRGKGEGVLADFTQPIRATEFADDS